MISFYLSFLFSTFKKKSLFAVVCILALSCSLSLYFCTNDFSKARIWRRSSYRIFKIESLRCSEIYIDLLSYSLRSLILIVWNFFNFSLLSTSLLNWVSCACSSFAYCFVSFTPGLVTDCISGSLIESTLFSRADALYD